MKRKRFLLLMTAVTMMAALTVSCTKEKENENIQETPAEQQTNYATLVGTSWEGTYKTTFNTPDYGPQQMTLGWTVDFNTETNGEVLMVVKTPVSDDLTHNYDDMEYTYNPEEGTGTVSYVVDNQQWKGGFVIDYVNRTMRCNLQTLLITTGNEADPPTPFGGETELHQTR